MNGVLITFDYELFLGSRSGTVARCMLTPTREILKILSDNNAKAVFFVDSYYLHRLKIVAAEHERAAADYEQIRQQVITMANQGHYVFYHIHPHWLDAVYGSQQNQWSLPTTRKFCFSNLDETERTSVFDDAANALNQILAQAVHYQQPNGFRAGGLYVQPFMLFKEHFIKHNILFDFSVLLGAEGRGNFDGQQFNYAGLFKSRYRFESEVSIEDNSGCFYEFALEFFTLSGYHKLLNKLENTIAARISNLQHYGDGLPTGNRISRDKSRFPEQKLTSYEIFSAENLSHVKIRCYMQHLAKTHFLHLLSHPKLMSPHSLSLFNRLMKKLNKQGNVEYDFKKFGK